VDPNPNTKKVRRNGKQQRGATAKARRPYKRHATGVPSALAGGGLVPIFVPAALLRPILSSLAIPR
jgi:hypothetical protein